MKALALQVGRTGLLLILSFGPLTACGESDAPDDVVDATRASEIAEILPAEAALAGAHVPTLDPATMNDAEVRKAIKSGALCAFRYTRSGGPVLAASMQPDGTAGDGIVKLNGNMVALTPAPRADAGQAGGLLLHADPIRITVTPDRTDLAQGGNGAGHREANMVFEIGQRLKVGYRGYLDCSPEPPRQSTG